MSKLTDRIRKSHNTEDVDVAIDILDKLVQVTMCILDNEGYLDITEEYLNDEIRQGNGGASLFKRAREILTLVNK